MFLRNLINFKKNRSNKKYSLAFDLLNNCDLHGLTCLVEVYTLSHQYGVRCPSERDG